MSEVFGVDVDLRRAERTYREIRPEDDDFHDEEMSDRWWETETCWFSWNIPERKLGGWTYCQARPNAHLCNGGAWVWDGGASYPWELLYRAEYSGLQLPPREERDMRDFEWPNGVHVRALEPLRRYAVTYSDPGALELELEFEAIMAPNPHPTGVVPFLKGAHFDQAGHVTGVMVLRDEEVPIDCFSVRDRSWGPRPQGRPKRRSGEAGSQAGSFGGVGYSFCAAGPGEAWLVYAVPGSRCGSRHVWLRAPRRSVRAHPGRGAPPHLRPRHRVAAGLRDRGGGRVRPPAVGPGRLAQSTLAGSRWRLTGPLALGRSRGLGRGPELLQPRPVGGQSAASCRHATRRDNVTLSRRRPTPHLIATSTILTTTRARATTR